MPKSETREELLKELTNYASPSLVAAAARLDSDEQIRELIASAKSQEAFYAAAGVEDMSKSG